MNLTVDPIPRLIRQLAIPASIGFFFNTMYNVVDTWFAGLISTDALAALSLSFPIFFIILAVGAGVSQGATALIANALGSDDPARAMHFGAQAMVFGLVLSVLMTCVGWSVSPSLFRLLGASGSYLDLSMAYMDTILAGTVFFLLQSILNGVLNAQGDTKSFRNLLMAGFVLNLILDPWLLYGGWGIPPLGVRGIALATVIIQGMGTLFMVWRLSKTPIWEHMSLSRLRPRAGLMTEIARQGIPASLNMMSVALGIFVITFYISRFSAEGVAAYGIATRIEQILLLPTIGLNIAVLSLVGQNNGAGLLDRVEATWKTALTYGLWMMVAGGGLLFLVARPMMSFFTEDLLVIDIGVQYLRVAALTLAAYVILYQTVYMMQGMKRPMPAVWIGLYRQIIGPVLVFQLLAFGWNWKLPGIWWGIFTITWSAAIFTWFYGRGLLRKDFEAAHAARAFSPSGEGDGRHADSCP